MGNIPYGNKHESEKEIVEQIKFLKMKGQCASAIAASLNVARTPSPNGKNWNVQSVINIINRETAKHGVAVSAIMYQRCQ